MDNLAIANLLQNEKGKALKMLNRILYVQSRAFGPDDRRCAVTLSKINTVETRDKELIDRIWKVNEKPSDVKSQHNVGHKLPRMPRKTHKGFKLRNSLRLKKNAPK